MPSQVAPLMLDYDGDPVARKLKTDFKYIRKTEDAYWIRARIKEGVTVLGEFDIDVHEQELESEVEYTAEFEIDRDFVGRAAMIQQGEITEGNDTSVILPVNQFVVIVVKRDDAVGDSEGRLKCGSLDVTEKGTEDVDEDGYRECCITALNAGDMSETYTLYAIAGDAVYYTAARSIFVKQGQFELAELDIDKTRLTTLGTKELYMLDYIDCLTYLGLLSPDMTTREVTPSAALRTFTPGEVTRDVSPDAASYTYTPSEITRDLTPDAATYLYTDDEEPWGESDRSLVLDVEQP